MTVDLTDREVMMIFRLMRWYRRNYIKCGAKTRKGTPCQCRVPFGKKRCRLHGGASTGPRPEVGRGRIAEAQRRRWQAWRAARRLGSTSTT